jgi:hypothetical protein
MMRTTSCDTHCCSKTILDIGNSLSTGDAVGVEVRAECGLVDGRRTHSKRIVDIGIGGRGKGAVDVAVTRSLPDRLMDRDDTFSIPMNKRCGEKGCLATYSLSRIGHCQNHGEREAQGRSRTSDQSMRGWCLSLPVIDGDGGHGGLLRDRDRRGGDQGQSQDEEAEEGGSKRGEHGYRTRTRSVEEGRVVYRREIGERPEEVIAFRRGGESVGGMQALKE